MAVSFSISSTLKVLKTLMKGDNKWDPEERKRGDVLLGGGELGRRERLVRNHRDNLRLSRFRQAQVEVRHSKREVGPQMGRRGSTWGELGELGELGS